MWGSKMGVLAAAVVTWTAPVRPAQPLGVSRAPDGAETPVAMHRVLRHEAAGLPAGDGGVGTGTRTAVAKPSVVVYGMRKFPYPYQAMLAISSDADHETLRKFNLIHTFLNTTQMTPMGRGLGLDIADSFFMYNGSNLRENVDWHESGLAGEFTYFYRTSDIPFGAKIIDRYIHAGWIDAMHSFGDFSMQNPHQTLFRRQLAVQAIRTLEAHKDFVTVWTDHGNQSNVDNFGAWGVSRFYRYQQGALPGSPYHVTDLLIPYGIRFVWADIPSARFGYPSIIYPLRLPDGRKVWGFWRYTSSSIDKRGDSHWVWSVDDLSQVLTIRHLLEIEWGHEYAIVATHLCSDNDVNPLPGNAVAALRLLQHQYLAGHILVARTSRLLQYNVTQRYLQYYVTRSHQEAVIHITGIADPVFGWQPPTLANLRGVTFYTSDPARTQIDIWNTPVNPALIQRNPTDGVHPSIGIRWYPPDTRNYAVTPPLRRIEVS
ncbi:hypothetical protein GCM10010885_18140 [Alicyclobacillus cellulosilyticus]|uniref:Uncharacterized protein n=1 Tax=Alicyclobacillus cellulosilyticus TaxID=1003997 RepID=A0A917KFM6_9BACL|nr:hypothetical protein GCM10010885_18140 [Alicyclobacillus cellulosilyticus]